MLSVDIDSFDYQVWQHTRRYRPIVVVIEIDSGVAPGEPAQRIYDPRDPSSQLTTFEPMLALGRAKGYSLAAHTGNMIFVRDDYAPRARLRDLNSPALFCREFLSRH